LKEIIRKYLSDPWASYEIEWIAGEEDHEKELLKLAGELDYIAMLKVP